MTGTILDASELTPVAVALHLASELALAEAAPIVAKGALNVKTTARRLAPRGTHTPFYEQSISYDITSGPGYVEAEIGPAEGRRQRGLGNLLEYGSVHNAPHPHHEPAADEEEPRFWAQAEALAARLVERRW